MTDEQESHVTPVHRFRCSDDLWDPAVAPARGEGTTMSAKIRGWIIKSLAGDLT